MNAADLKIEALAWLRFKMRMPVTCTEVQEGAWNPDVVGISPKLYREIEVKVSLQDFYREFKTKKSKIWTYLNCCEAGTTETRMSGTPNFFYYMVPEPLVKEIEPVVEEKIKQAGILSVPSLDRRWGDNLVVARPPKKLHTSAPDRHLLHSTFLRMSSELITQKAGYRVLAKAFDELAESVNQKVAAIADAGQRTSLLPEGFHHNASRLLAWTMESVNFDDLPPDRQRFYQEKAEKMIAQGSAIPETWLLGMESKYA